VTHVRVALALLFIGAACLIGYFFAAPWLEERMQLASSDAQDTKGTISIGVDNWVGYFPLCSPVMKRNLRQAGFVLRCQDDKADYAKRMGQLASGELGFAVATVDSYLLNGSKESFPATIVLVIDESKGGDAIVARRDKVARIEDLRTAQGVKIAFTPGSPSEHLVKAIGAHFDIAMLRQRAGPWRVETQGSSEAREKLEKGEVDVAVLWEPDVSRALASDELTKLLGTEDTQKLIVDVLLVRRELSVEQPEMVSILLSQYFETLRYYRENPEELRKELGDATDLPDAQVESMLRGVRWATLQDNALVWFGIDAPGQTASEGIVDAIESAAQILKEAGDFGSDPLPEGDAYRILHSQPIEQLFAGRTFGTVAAQDSAESLVRAFEPLAAERWEALQPVGTLKVRPITFQSGTAQLSLEGKLELDRAAENLSHYPNFRVVVAGHSGVRGDADENLRLSQERADAVARYLQVTYGIDEDRLRAVGRGASQPLPKEPGESARSYNYRLPRVELLLAAEVY